MAYSRSPETLDRIRHLLVKLENGEECEWEVVPGTEIDFAQKIREALFVASIYPAYYPKLKDASITYKIERPRKKPGFVRAVKRRAITALDVLALDRAILEAPPIVSRAPARAQAETVRDIIDGWTSLTQLSPEVQQVEFPTIVLDTEQLLELYEWTNDQELLFFTIPGGGIRVCTATVELAPLAWDPSDLETLSP